MGIELVDVSQSEFEQVFTAVKQGIFPYNRGFFPMLRRSLAGMTNFNVNG